MGRSVDNIIKEHMSAIAKPLTFYYGAMTAGKTMHLLSLAKSLELRGKNVLICKPFVNESWSSVIESRCGMRRALHVMIKQDSDLLVMDLNEVDDIIVDDAQFLSGKHVNELREITTRGIPVYCYGLKVNFKGELFEGSQTLLACSDVIEEFKSQCWYCERNATHVLRLKGGDQEVEVEMPGEMNYAPVCYNCWRSGYGKNN